MREKGAREEQVDVREIRSEWKNRWEGEEEGGVVLGWKEEQH